MSGSGVQRPWNGIHRLKVQEDKRANESSIWMRDKVRQAPVESPANTIDDGAIAA